MYVAVFASILFSSFNFNAKIANLSCNSIQSFLSAQLIFSFLPLLLFTIFGASTVAFAVGGAILFALFWIGLGLLVLIPTLFITASIGLLVWAWAAGSFVVVRAVYRRVAAYNNNAAPPGKGGAANGQFKAQNGGS